MRIIGGEFKGRKIYLPKDRNTRPLRDLVKESIFNLIEYSNKISTSINGSNILDLFSGTGSFGLECISRKAGNVTFVENYVDALEVLKKNITYFNIHEKCKIIEKNCFEFIEKKNNFDEKFDIIFLDPPYKEEKINLIIDNIKNKKLLSDTGILLIHRHKKDDIEITKNLKLLDERSYGISKILIGN